MAVSEERKREWSVAMALGANVPWEEVKRARPAPHGLATAALHHAQLAGQAQTAAGFEALRRLREEDDPHRRIEAIDTKIEALKAEYQPLLHAVEAQIEVLRAEHQPLIAPWERKIQCLEYERDLIGHKEWGCAHPGEPPEGYEEGASDA
jgi:hypothetical protein